MLGWMPARHVLRPYEALGFERVEPRSGFDG